MESEQAEKIQAAADHVLDLEAELEAAGNAATGGSALEIAQAQLHKWIDTVKGVVVSPALGRVTLIHENGRFSTVSSPELPFTMSAPTGSKTGA
ncbi:MAG TPA: hypothetical protein VMB71_08845 [Acetobacteraceae bacterium]|nr:hypothetical protein [Acetobacteraceae bacterium]